MKCSQARAMLAAYRELQDDRADFSELEIHLEGCTECRQTLAQYNLIGSLVRSLPNVTPLPRAHARLMQALASEHGHFIQNTPTASAPVPIPLFLSPYLKDAHKTQQNDTITALSTADTGPLPVLYTPRRTHRSRPLPQFAIIGLAAVFLMVLMAGSLASLLLLANHSGPAGPSTVLIVQPPPQVVPLSYTTSTSYTHIASAIADQKSIYYSAYGDAATGWMIEQFDNKTKVSTPLLPVASPTPLIVLGSSNDWLIWLNMGPDKTNSKHAFNPSNDTERSWSLQATFIGSNSPKGLDSTGPITLLKDTFTSINTPGWIHTPIQGIWFTDHHLLVAAIDGKGLSSLLSIDLDQPKDLAPIALATGQNGHILSSPTATSDGKCIYWSEEWLTDDNLPHSNIWTQQSVTVPVGPGRWAPHSITNKPYLFRSDENSFHPQVVDNTLFLLNASATDSTAGTDATQGTPQSATPAPTAMSTPATNNPLSTLDMTRADPLVYPAQLDDSIHGTLLAFSADGSAPLQLPLGSTRQVSGLQGGPRFLIWQNSDNAFEMYDAVARSSVRVEPIIPKNAIFLAVNGNTTVWITAKDSNDSTSDGSTPPAVSFNMFEWPTGAAMTSGQ